MITRKAVCEMIRLVIGREAFGYCSQVSAINLFVFYIHDVSQFRFLSAISTKAYNLICERHR